MSESNNKQASSFLKGATILAGAGILSRLLGLFYKVPLYALVGSFGNGIYGNVTSIYNTLLMVSTVGLPVAISKMVSESVAVRDYRSAKKIFKISMTSLCIVGGISSCFLFFGANWLIEEAHWSFESYPAIIAVAAAPFIISICSAFRGYFQGFQIMQPTAISQIIEQIIRVGLGIILAWLCIRLGFGAGKGYTVGMSVGGAILGATIGGVFAAFFLAVMYIQFKKINGRIFLTGNEVDERSTGELLKKLLWISIPVTLTSSIVSLFSTVDSLIYIPQLAKAGIDSYTATTMFGDYTNVDTLINIPLVISGNISVAIIPAIAESFALHDRKMVSEKIDVAIRVCVMIALPCCVGLSVLSQGIFDLLFPGSEYGSGLMQVFSFATLFIMLSGIFQSILQSIDRMLIPMINLIFGAIIHIVSCYIFLSIPGINIYGIGFANLLTFTFLSGMNYFFVKKLTKVKFNWLNTFVKPLISAAIMGFLTWLVYTPVRALLGNVVALLISVIISVIIYAFLMIFTGCIGEKEISLLPGQKFIRPVFEKISHLRNKVFKQSGKRK